MRLIYKINVFFNTKVSVEKPFTTEQILLSVSNERKKKLEKIERKENSSML